MNRDVENELRQLFRRVPPPEPSVRLRQAVAADRVTSRPNRSRRFGFTRTGASLIGLAATLALAATLVVIAAGRPGRAAIGGASPSSPATARTSAGPSASASEPAQAGTPYPTTPPATPGPVAPGTFALTGSMADGDAAAGVLLADGRVLVIGGGATSPRLYDPGTGKFTKTGSMTMDRAGATVTRLADGRVLVVGGMGADTTATAELYDPKTGKFTRTGSMSQARMGQTATLLRDGRVLIAGGMPPAGLAMAAADRQLSDSGGRLTATGPDNLSSAELYNPKTGKFTHTGSMSVRRRGQTATLLASGLVLIAGGTESSAGGDGPPLSSAELYDPATGRFGAAGTMTAARNDHTATLLADGRVLIAGGVDDQGVMTVGSAEVYNPATGRFSATGSMHQAREEQTAIALPDGRVLVAGGLQLVYAADSGGGLSLKSWSTLASTELYDPGTGRFEAGATMRSGRYYYPPTAALSDGRVLIAGGMYMPSTTMDSESLSSAEIYTP